MPPPPAKPEAPPAPPPAAKPEKPAPPAVAAAASAAAAAAAEAASSSAPKGLRAWLPAIFAIIIAPAVTWAAVQFVFVPRIQEKLKLLPAGAVPANEAGLPTVEKGKDGKPVAPQSYDGFQSIVVNLAGTMGTRYLKASFMVVGDPKSNIEIKKVFEENRPKLYDLTLNILSSQTLADLEEPGAKNVVRERLISAYNQALGAKVAQQIYFSEFVIQ